MKIIMFQYNRPAAAILQSADGNKHQDRRNERFAAHRLSADGYTDRLLWEEAATLRPKKPQAFAIAGNWQ